MAGKDEPSKETLPLNRRKESKEHSIAGMGAGASELETGSRCGLSLIWSRETRGKAYPSDRGEHCRTSDSDHGLIC